MATSRKYAAELIGTFWLTLGGCGSAVLAAAFPDVGIGLLGVSLAFGLTVLTMAYAIGHVSGCHLNPAVTVGLAAGGRFPASDILPYIIAQVIGAILGAAVLYVIASGVPEFDVVASGFAANGYAEHSPGGYSLVSSFVAEVVLTMMFIFIIMGTTHGQAPVGFAPLAIGLALTLIHLISIPVTNTSVNPARSTGPALFVGGWALGQLWLFWLAPLLGGALGGLLYSWLSPTPTGIVEGGVPSK
ncbi:aquaporin Z [Yangia mangrovi]|uniref:Aquaporin Z n=1 Tax=Alloyangia mangrovi TaxID=1779329 RepID=A0A2A3JTH5_9RHOB|nr:aquaporin Z [Alloyangia mangrovi]MCT4370761.1 aquaporin Z [Alloyangia mangrovi]